MKYRAEIDGLRALAVVPVILFHAGIELFSGGFVGVDIFFVISGYLITTILVDEIENKRFSIVSFYERRARRILPALFFVVLACIPFSRMWMLPSQIEDFSQSLIFVSLFSSNILFWRESGYFDAVAEEKPLLHTWSLAVEEQYYLLFPIFLILSWRFGKSRVFWTIVTAAVVSLFLSEWGWRNKEVANFYLAPTRAWELFCGSIAAFIAQKRGVRKSNAISILGLVAIITSIFLYHKAIPFPSAYTLLPVVGVVLLLLYADKETITAQILSAKVFIGIGLISYSAYLWHQPLFAFARLYMAGSPSPALMLTLAGMSMVLGFLSWKYIEKPFRDKKLVSSHAIALLAPASLLITAGIGAYFLTNNAHLERDYYASLSSDKQLIYRELRGDGMRDKEWRHGTCFLTSKSDSFSFFDVNQCLSISKEKPNVLLMGDSHAAHWYPGIVENFPRLNVLQATSSGCRPILGTKGKERCENLFKYMFEKFIPNAPLDAIILAGRWEDKDTLEDISATLRFVKQYSKNVYLIGDVVEYEKALPMLLLRENSPSYSNKFLKLDRFAVSMELEKIAAAEGVNFISAISLVCSKGAGSCESTTPNGIPVAFDYGHLSIDASIYYVDKARNLMGFLVFE